MAVIVDSGPIEATDKLHQVPRDQWRSLMVARRLYLRTKLSHDCRCLVEFVDDARQMFEPLGFGSIEAMIHDGYGLSPEEIDVALDWLRLNPPAAPLPFETAKQLAIKAKAETARARDAADQAKQREGGRPKKAETVYNAEIDVNGFRPVGNSAEAALRRLRKDRPDIHARVLAGELSPHAGMVEAGFRKKAARRAQTPLQRILKLLPELSADEVGRLQDNIEILLWQRGDRAA